MGIFGKILFVGGVIGCVVCYLNGKLNLVSPELFMSGVAVVAGAVLWAGDEVAAICGDINVRLARKKGEQNATAEETTSETP